MDSMVEVTVLLEHFVSGIVDPQLFQPSSCLSNIVLLEYLEYMFMFYWSISTELSIGNQTQSSNSCLLNIYDLYVYSLAKFQLHMSIHFGVTAL